MDMCSCLLDQAFLLLDIEGHALDREEEDLLLFFSEIRMQVLNEAWTMRGSCDPGLLETRLEAMVARQEELTQRLLVWQERMRDSLQKSKAYNKFAAGSRYNTRAAGKQFYHVAEA